MSEDRRKRIQRFEIQLIFKDIFKGVSLRPAPTGIFTLANVEVNDFHIDTKLPKAKLYSRNGRELVSRQWRELITIVLCHH